MESPLEYQVHLAREMLEHGNYTHNYKRERDFDLSGACIHFKKLNETLSHTNNMNKAHLKFHQLVPKNDINS